MAVLYVWPLQRALRPLGARLVSLYVPPHVKAVKSHSGWILFSSEAECYGRPLRFIDAVPGASLLTIYVMLLESLAVLANVFIFKTALVQRYHYRRRDASNAWEQSSRWELSSWPQKKCLTEMFRKGLHGLTANERKPAFWFVGLCARAKARFNFHKASTPAWPVSSIPYGLWSNLPPHCLISYKKVWCERCSPFMCVSCSNDEVQLSRALLVLLPIISNLSVAGRFFTLQIFFELFKSISF